MHGYYYSGNLTQTEITISDYKYFSNRNYSESNRYVLDNIIMHFSHTSIIIRNYLLLLYKFGVIEKDI